MPRRNLLVFTAVAAWSITLLCDDAARAAAQTLVALDYETPADTSCPDADEFRASVARQLHYDPFRPTADRRVGVQISRKEVGFDGRIRWTDGEGNWVGERRLSSRRPECREIVASVAFSVAVQVQLLAALAAPVPEPPRLPLPRRRRKHRSSSSGRRPRRRPHPPDASRCPSVSALPWPSG